MKKRSFVFLLLLLILVACGKEKEEQAKPETEKPVLADPVAVEQKSPSPAQKEEKPEARQLPSTLAELAALPPGYTEFIPILKEEGQKKMDQLTEGLPDISGERSEQELDHYYLELLSIFQHDFIGPEELIAKLKFQAIGSPDADEPRRQFKDNLNVLILLDASGSMNQDNDGESQMEAAKKAIASFLRSLPKDANVGLRIYGHEGSGSDADKERSCSSSELIYPLSAYDESNFQSALDRSKPAGWTPIQLAIDEAKKDLAPHKGENSTNIVYLVSDGISTCDDDPVTAAKALYDSDITPIINVIGFNIDNEGRSQLQEVAKAANGTYEDVQNADSLEKELLQAGELAKKWEAWKKDKTSRLEWDRVKNWNDIWNYFAREFGKVVDERQGVGFALQYLRQDRKLMSSESYGYLQKKNQDYHQWINEEHEKMKADLYELNDRTIDETIRLLEEKYEQNKPQ